MNKEIYTTKIEKTIKDVLIKDEGVSLVFDDGTISLSSYHSQDCCESVYADFSVIKYYKELITGKNVRDLIIKSVESMGFLLCFEIGYSDNIKIFIGCYNYQNGCYGSDLSLVINKDGTETKVDVSNLVEDHVE